MVGKQQQQSVGEGGKSLSFPTARCTSVMSVGVGVVNDELFGQHISKLIY